MKKSTIVICVSVILVLAIAGSLFLLLKPQEPSLLLQIGKPAQFDADGNINGLQVFILEDREQTEIILLSLINSRPVPESEFPTAVADGRITVHYGGCGYPYDVWFYEDSIIFSNGSTDYRKIFNDHNNPVSLIKELIGSIKTTFPG